MRLHSLGVEQFRNLETVHLSFSSPVVVFSGVNGQGKTSLLEAISVLADGRSFRTRRLSQTIRWGEEQARIAGRVERAGTVLDLDLTLQGSQKSYGVGGKKAASLLEYVGRLMVVALTPQDIALVEGEPQLRRDFLDRGVFLLRPAYLKAWQDYYRLLQARNSWLKGQLAAGVWEPVWDETLASLAAEITRSRREVAEKIREVFRDLHPRITGNREEVEFRFQPSCEDHSPEAILRLWGESAEQDRNLGYTTKGPHRDDWSLVLGEPQRRLQWFGSLGQKRSAVIALVLALSGCVQKNLGEAPLLLLDDVEIDEERTGRVFDILERDFEAMQIFVTTIHPEKLDRLQGKAQRFQIVQGRPLTS